MQRPRDCSIHPPSPKHHVALVGFMGAGKTTVGRRLATELGLPFLDTDELIVAARGPIHDIFAREGVTAFRAYEFAAVQQALGGEGAVVALGGGALTHPPTRAIVAERALRVFLEVPLAVLLRRLRRAPTIRPVLGDAPTEARVRELLAAREPLYREADVIVAGGRRSRADLARTIAVLVREAQAGRMPNAVLGR